MTYNLFQKLLECIDPPEQPVPSIDGDFLGDATTPIKYDHNEIFGVPTLEELGKYLHNAWPYVKLIHTLYFMQCISYII